MATVITYKGLYTIYKGDGENDNINSTARYTEIDSDDGDDNINVNVSVANFTNFAKTFIYTRNGNDIVNASGYKMEVYGGDGNDILTLNTYSSMFVLGGSGDDVFDLTAGEYSSNIIAGISSESSIYSEFAQEDFGDDTIKFNAPASYIYDYHGNNTITGIGTAHEVVTGDGDDEIHLSYSTKEAFFISEHSSYVNAGDGNNIVEINSGGINAEETNYVKTGSGSDTITISNLTSDAKSGFVVNNTIDSGDGGDTINIAEGNNVINSGNGDDTIVSGYKDDNYTIGTGTNDIKADDGNNSIDAVGSTNSVLSGNGDDYIHIVGNNNNINAGDGDNIINVSGITNNIISGGGNDYIAVSGASSSTSSIIGGLGKDILIGGNGHDTFKFDFIRGDSTSLDTDIVKNFAQGSDKIEIFNTNNDNLNFDSLRIEYSSNGKTAIVSYSDDAGHDFKLNISGSSIDHNHGHDLTSNDFTFSNEHNILGIG